MKKVINILEIASNLAQLELGKLWEQEERPENLFIEEDNGDTRYNADAQEIFNDLYDKYHSLLQKDSEPFCEPFFTTNDITDYYKCDESDAEGIIEDLNNNEWLIGEINSSIRELAEDYGYEELKNEDEDESLDVKIAKQIDKKLSDEYDSFPQEVKDILDSFDEEQGKYVECSRIQAELDSIGYSSDFGLEGEIVDVKPKKQ